MTTTQNLHLPQWEADDRIMRTDFNDAMSKLDAGVKALQTAVNGKTTPAEVSAAISAATAGFGNCRIWTTTYTGNGQYGASHPTVINFPARPLLVYIRELGTNRQMWEAHGANTAYCNFLVESGASGFTCTASWSGTRFSFYNTVEAPR